MNEESVTKGLRPRIRLGLSAAIIAGLSVLGAGALEAGTAGAITTGGGGVIKLLPTCPSTVSLSTTYGYTYVIKTGEVVDLSGSGCSTSSHPVTVTFEDTFVDPGWTGGVSDTVTPSCSLGPTDCTFSFSYALPNSPFYLTLAEAALAGEGNAGDDPMAFLAKQPATGASTTMDFNFLYIDE
jgi:hypothetical protein